MKSNLLEESTAFTYLDYQFDETLHISHPPFPAILPASITTTIMWLMLLSPTILKETFRWSLDYSPSTSTSVQPRCMKLIEWDHGPWWTGFDCITGLKLMLYQANSFGIISDAKHQTKRGTIWSLPIEEKVLDKSIHDD